MYCAVCVNASYLWIHRFIHFKSKLNISLFFVIYSFTIIFEKVPRYLLTAFIYNIYIRSFALQVICYRSFSNFLRALVFILSKTITIS